MISITPLIIMFALAYLAMQVSPSSIVAQCASSQSCMLPGGVSSPQIQRRLYIIMYIYMSGYNVYIYIYQDIMCIYMHIYQDIMYSLIHYILNAVFPLSTVFSSFPHLPSLPTSTPPPFPLKKKRKPPPPGISTQQGITSYSKNRNKPSYQG